MGYYLLIDNNSNANLILIPSINTATTTTATGMRCFANLHKIHLLKLIDTSHKVDYGSVKSQVVCVWGEANKNTADEPPT